jgi:hypothetical protein
MWQRFSGKNMCPDISVQHCDIYQHSCDQTNARDHNLMPWNEVAACGISVAQSNNENVNINMVNINLQL